MNSAMLKRVTMYCITAVALGAAAVSANATVYTATLSGAIEVPPNASPGTGTITLDFDLATHTMTIDVTFSGLLAGTTIAHIHCCTAEPETGTAPPATQVPTLTGFPAGATSGTYTRTFDTLDATTWNPAFITASGGTAADDEEAFLAGLDGGRAYLNLHTEFAPGGEIRGFLQPVPEPATFALLALGAPVVLVAARRRRAK